MTRSEEGNRIIVRECALDSGTLTTDTELVRMSHCGGFYLDRKYVSGCVQSCHEDACNAAAPLLKLPGLASVNMLVLLLLPLSSLLASLLPVPRPQGLQ